MELRTWLGAERGRAAALAQHLEVSAGRISQMAADGVPVAHMVAVRDFTGGEVTIEEMVLARNKPIPEPATEGEVADA